MTSYPCDVISSQIDIRESMQFCHIIKITSKGFRRHRCSFIFLWSSPVYLHPKLLFAKEAS